MATLMLSIVIFGSAAGIVYRQIKKGSSCEDCECSCPVKKESKVSE
ncbi:FeoB-associated Cys-rich membrane protein [Enterococcus sp. CSURQ0835]|nr:FeoB-associated Cys-rich membrane protein [Enterococcus sp. CSURQ0835]